MAFISPEQFDIDNLRTQVRATYDSVAREPEANYHFHRGAEYAELMLGYNRDELRDLPIEATARFAGVGNPILIGDSDPTLEAIRPGQTVLDHACGAGMDVLLAARRVGPHGKVIGVDMTPAMRDCAKAAADLAGMTDIVDIRAGMYENLPVDDESVDVVISNGVVNLAPNKVQVFDEIYRSLKPGGYLFMADVVVQQELSYESRCNPDLWAACIAGALVEGELEQLATQTGMIEVRVVRRFNCFYGTTAEKKIAKRLFVHSVNFLARKPMRNT